MFLEKPICTDCGEEIERGIDNYANHFWQCKRDALNENIEIYKKILNSKTEQKGIELKFKKVFKKMNKEERNRLINLSYSGFLDIRGEALWMYPAAYEELWAYKEQMINKYLKNNK